MKVSFSRIQSEVRQAVEEVAARHIEKLEKLLKRYAPDLVQLHGDLVKRPRRSDFNFSLNLILPTGTLHASAIAADAPASVRATFAELEGQVKKHKEKVRKDYEWKRKRPRNKAGK